MGRKLDEGTEQRIIEMLNNKCTHQQIRDEVGVSEPTIARVRLRNLDKVVDTYHKGGVQAGRIQVNPIPKKVKPVEEQQDAVLVVGERMLTITGYSDITYRLNGKELVLEKGVHTIHVELSKLPILVKELLTIERKILELGLGNTEVW